jgi:hypothetical protein
MLFVGELPVPQSFLTVFLVVIAISALSFCLAIPAFATSAWSIQTVDVNGDGYGNGYCPIVVDSNSTPHIAYTGAYGFVMYASWNGSSWNTQTIAEGTAFSLVLDAKGNPYILYGAPLGPLMYASWTGTNWTVQTVDGTFSNGFGSVAIDSFGYSHVAYTDGQVLKYASWTGSSWSIQTVDNYSEIPFQLSLALDSNNAPYIFYDHTISIPENGVGYSGNNLGAYFHIENLKFAVLKNSGWSIQTVANASGFGNMILDSKGSPHLIYEVNYPEITGTNNSTLVYASWNGAAWKTQTVVSNASLVVNGADASMGFLYLDSHDYPNIAYIKGTAGYSGTLMYASWTGNAWNIQTVDSNINTLNNYATGPCYLVVDSNGNPHIGYLANPPDAGLPSPILYVMYATATEPTTSPTTSISPSPTVTPLPTTPILDSTSTLIVIGAVVIVLVLVVVFLAFRRKVKEAKELPKALS